MEEAVSYVEGWLPEASRSFWFGVLGNLMGGGATELEGERRLELEGVSSHCNPSASKAHLSTLREKLTELGMGGESWATQNGRLG